MQSDERTKPHHFATCFCASEALQRGPQFKHLDPGVWPEKWGSPQHHATTCNHQIVVRGLNPPRRGWLVPWVTHLYNPHVFGAPGSFVCNSSSMGNGASRQSAQQAAADLPSTSGGGAAAAAHPAGGQEPTCPVPEQYRHQSIYNVYNQRVNDPAAPAGGQRPPWQAGRADLLDPKNNMPLEPNQQPCPGQKKLLPTDRMQSTIPKGGTDSTWVYPSPQMFFNGAPAGSRVGAAL